MPGIIDADIKNNQLTVVSQDGLHLFYPIETLQEMPREYQKRASPLTLVFGDKILDITDTTHPGMHTILATNDNPCIFSGTAYGIYSWP